jgi:hypothetical protein
VIDFLIIFDGGIIYEKGNYLVKIILLLFARPMPLNDTKETALLFLGIKE